LVEAQDWYEREATGLGRRFRQAIEALQAMLPPTRFRFRGFTVFRATEVTDQEVLSALKRDLIDKASIVSSTRFDGLQERLRTFFRRPDLRFGLSAVAGDRLLVLHAGSRLQHQCIFADSTHHQVADLAGSLYTRAIREGRTQTVEVLAAQPQRTCAEDGLLQSGVRSLVVAPLVYGETVIGCLELGSPHPGDLTGIDQAPRLQEILPLFAMAVKRGLDELNSRIQASIKASGVTLKVTDAFDRMPPRIRVRGIACVSRSSPSQPRPWKAYGEVRGLNTPPRSTCAPWSRTNRAAAPIPASPTDPNASSSRTPRPTPTSSRSTPNAFMCNPSWFGA
jgi:hypothetical protein